MTAPDTMGRVVPYDASKHEGFVLESWARAWSRSRAGVALGVDNQRSPQWFAFFESVRPFILMLLQTERVTVVVDTETPDVIWGWMACSPDGSVLHEVVIKRELTKLAAGEDVNEEARDMALELLGDMIRRPMGHTGELESMRRLDLRRPTNWYYDTTYLMRKLLGEIRGKKAA